MRDANSYPVFLDLTDRAVLIVGGGAVGARKARGLLACGALVTVVSIAFSPEFLKMERVERICAPYVKDHVLAKPWRLVFAATDVEEINAAVGRDAAAAGIFCCRCDDPEEGDFAGGAVMRIGGVTVAVSTGGASPVVGKRIREQVAGAIDTELAALAGLLAQWRGRVKAEVQDPHARRALLNRLGGTEMEASLRDKGAPAATELFERWLAQTCAKPEVGRE